MKTLFILLACGIAVTSHAQLDAQKLARFRAETNLVGKHTLVRELMLTGGDQAFIEFKRSLFDPNVARRLTFLEEAYMLSLVECMGYLAVTSNIVRDFLLEAVNPRFWKTNISWTTELREREYSVLAGRALISLAVSGRREFDSIAETVRQDPGMGGHQYGLASDLVDAYFYKHLVEIKGWPTYLQMGAEEISWEFPVWKKTSVGSNWVQWGRSIEFPDK
jgi:hypothetical protein